MPPSPTTPQSGELRDPLLKSLPEPYLQPLSAPSTASADHRHHSSFLHTIAAAIPSAGAYPLLVFLPLGLIAGVCGWNPVLVSIYNFLAIIPLSALVSDSSDALSDYLGDLLGGLVNASLGNSVELSTGILAVASGDFYFAQCVMIGSILSDLLLILGCCLVTASYNTYILHFNKPVTGALASLMVVTSVGLILPSVLYSTFPFDLGDQIVSFSRGTSVVLLVLYGGYLYFQLGTHSHLFQQQSSDQDEVDSSPEPRRDLNKSLFILALSTLAIVACTRYILASIPATAIALNISKTFIATILIPIASNAPEGAAVIMACTGGGDVNFAISVIVSSILQIGLFVIPFLVMLGWPIGQPMTLYFETFHTVVLFFSVLLVNCILQDGKYTYIHGSMLVAMYAILTLAFYVR
ncbi:vacuolar calcium ion transporter [Aspergillus heteromorphus CBS 117.55]|uniref:Vacuolar calcium ion transporter n=1 Tax=Aspergillus heteromorphus CBS 117.55 TaxID=1448321 RepID=A0A317UXI3_9EURO|nr:vacuolar calcium ion transporter [Aspergillus heteromorphus CBS 117.55]PWY66744.1 vacuolar calcium ion transporter [Aspergillus heteromorphus CBS 117.55]